MDNDECLITDAIIKQPKPRKDLQAQHGYGEHFNTGGQWAPPLYPGITNNMVQGHQQPWLQHRNELSMASPWNQSQATSQQILRQQPVQNRFQMQPSQNHFSGQMLQGHHYAPQPQYQHAVSAGTQSNLYNQQMGEFKSQKQPFVPTSSYGQQPPTYSMPVPNGNTNVSGPYQRCVSETRMQTSSVGASPTQLHPNLMPSSNYQLLQGASAQALVREHRHFACSFSFKGESCSLTRCLEGKCALVPMNDGGFSEIYGNWLYQGPVGFKSSLVPYASKLITEESQDKARFDAKMAWLRMQPHSATGVLIKDLAPPEIKVFAKILDMNKKTASPSAASRSISPGLTHQHQNPNQVNQAQQSLYQTNQAQLVTQVHQISQRQMSHIAAQPQFAQENLQALQQQINEINQPKKLSPGGTSRTNGLPPVPPLQRRPDFAAVSDRQRQQSENHATDAQDTTSSTPLQTVDDWDRFLSTAGMLVIAPEPQENDTDGLNQGGSSRVPAQVDLIGISEKPSTPVAVSSTNVTGSGTNTSTVGRGHLIGSLPVPRSVPNMTGKPDFQRVKTETVKSTCISSLDQLASSIALNSPADGGNHRMPPLHIPTGFPNAPEFVNLDLLSGINLTPDKVTFSNPLDSELKEKNSKEIKKDDKLTKTQKKVSDLDSETDENYRPFNSGRKRRRDDDDKDYEPEFSPEQRKSRGNRWRESSDSSDNFDSDSWASESSLSLYWSSESDADLPQRKSKRKRRRRRVYISDDESDGEAKKPDPEIKIHKLTRREIKKIKLHLRNGRFRSIKYSLHCSKCKLIKKKRKHNVLELSDSDTEVEETKMTGAESETGHSEQIVDNFNATKIFPAVPEDNECAAEDVETVVSLCTTAGSKEPFHEPLTQEGNNGGQNSAELENEQYAGLPSANTQKSSVTTNFSLETNHISSSVCNAKETPKNSDDKTSNVENKTWEKLEDLTSEEDVDLLLNTFLSRNDVYECKCGMIFIDKTLYWLHRNNYHKQNNTLACGVCTKVCGSKEDLIVHHQQTACHPKDD